jgi:putative nucleotidyltransferase with HDIG domain
LINNKTEKLILLLTDLSMQVFKGNYKCAHDLFDLTKQGSSKDIIEQLAEAFGLMMVKVEAREYQSEQLIEALSKSVEQTNQVLKGVIFAISAIFAKRDPYTAGHQLRVASLSVKIAQEMGLADEMIEGLRVAGVLHDIGKISVPAEILCKPTKLSDIEFSLIKCHSEVGYDILKTIEFPWPVAQAAYQHHERLNGEGYPRCLCDKDIIIEAKIIGVADVVEAMASHRPYRAALGIDRALDEIVRNKGKFYEPSAVEACEAVFNKGLFNMSAESI